MKKDWSDRTTNKAVHSQKNEIFSSHFGHSPFQFELQAQHKNVNEMYAAHHRRIETGNIYYSLYKRRQYLVHSAINYMWCIICHILSLSIEKMTKSLYTRLSYMPGKLILCTVPSYFSTASFFRLTSMNLIHFHLLFWLFKPYKWIIPDFHIFGTYGINFDVIYGMRPVWYITNRTCLECPFWPENNELYWEKLPRFANHHLTETINMTDDIYPTNIIFMGSNYYSLVGVRVVSTHKSGQYYRQ